MDKLSKKDLSTPEYEARADAARAALEAKRQTCWDVGQIVWMDGDRGKILDHYRRIHVPTRTSVTLLTVQWDDGRLTTIKPIALNR